MREPRRAFLLMAVTAVVIVPAALAAGATPAAPTVATAAATNGTASGATLNGTVNPNGQPTEYAFQWGPTTGYGHETALSSGGAGTSALSVNAALGGIASGSTYHFRIIAINAAGAAVGSDQQFNTTGTAPPPSASPHASTASATSTGQSGTTLGGTVNPEGQATSYYFEYGQTANYGFQTAPVSAGSGSTGVPAAASLTALPSGTSYHFRLVAVSAGGTALGSDGTFKTTTPPAVSTGAASDVSTSSALLNGTVNPQGHTTTYRFQFGTTTGYDLETPPAGAGSDTGTVAVHESLAGLLAQTVYHYRIVAQSSGGTSYGADKTFSTASPPVTPSRFAVLGKMGFVSPGGWVGVVIDCFGGQTHCIGSFSLTDNGKVVGRLNFNVAPESGGSQNLRLNALGRRLTGRGYRTPLKVQLTVTGTSGQRISETIRLARWH